MIGVQYVSLVQADSQGIYAPYVVTNSGHWVYGGTGFSDGDTVLGLVGLGCIVQLLAVLSRVWKPIERR